MKKLKLVIIPLAIVILAVAWYARYTSLNQFYDSLDNCETLTCSTGEFVSFGEDEINYHIQADGYLICVNGVKVVDFAEVCPDIEGNTPEKLALVDITLKNVGSDAEGVPLAELRLYGIDELLFLDYDALDRLNPVLQGNSGITLSTNTEYRLTLPYGLYKANFSHGTWNSLDRYDLFLQLTAYPTRKIIVLQ